MRCWKDKSLPDMNLKLGKEIPGQSCSKLQLLRFLLTHYCPTATVVTVFSKFRVFKKEGIMEQITYEHRAYESVDDKRLS